MKAMQRSASVRSGLPAYLVCSLMKLFKSCASAVVRGRLKKEDMMKLEVESWKWDF